MARNASVICIGSISLPYKTNKETVFRNGRRNEPFEFPFLNSTVQILIWTHLMKGIDNLQFLLHHKNHVASKYSQRSILNFYIIIYLISNPMI